MGSETAHGEPGVRNVQRFMMFSRAFYGRPMEQGRPLYFHPVVTSVFLLSYSFFPCLISAVRDWMSTILPHMVWP